MALREAYGITDPDFRQWKHHPVTQAVFRFLNEKQRFLKEQALQQWLDGTMGLGDDKGQCLRGQIIELEVVLGLEFGQMAGFDDEQRAERDGFEGTAAEGGGERQDA